MFHEDKCTIGKLDLGCLLSFGERGRLVRPSLDGVWFFPAKGLIAACDSFTCLRIEGPKTEGKSYLLNRSILHRLHRAMQSKDTLTITTPKALKVDIRLTVPDRWGKGTSTLADLKVERANPFQVKPPNFDKLVPWVDRIVEGTRPTAFQAEFLGRLRNVERASGVNGMTYYAPKEELGPAMVVSTDKSGITRRVVLMPIRIKVAE